MTPRETEVIDNIRKSLVAIESGQIAIIPPPVDVSLTLPVKNKDACYIGLTAILFGLRLIELAAGVSAN